MPRTFLAFMFVTLLLGACNRVEPLPKFGDVPKFSLLDQDAKAVTPATLSGKVWVVDFIFTSCPDVCPLLTENLAGVRKRLPQDPALTYVSFSVDPEHDTPAKLTAFAAQHGANQANWRFLTGPIDEVKRVVVQGFKQAMQAEPKTNGKPFNVLHGTHFVLVDRNATIRGFFRSDAEGIAQLEAATKILLAEGSAR